MIPSHSPTNTHSSQFPYFTHQIRQYMMCCTLTSKQLHIMIIQPNCSNWNNLSCYYAKNFNFRKQFDESEQNVLLFSDFETMYIKLKILCQKNKVKLHRDYLQILLQNKCHRIQLEKKYWTVTEANLLRLISQKMIEKDIVAEKVDFKKEQLKMKDKNIQTNQSEDYQKNQQRLIDSYLIKDQQLFPKSNKKIKPNLNQQTTNSNSYNNSINTEKSQFQAIIEEINKQKHKKDNQLLWSHNNSGQSMNQKKQEEKPHQKEHKKLQEQRQVNQSKQKKQEFVQQQKKCVICLQLLLDNQDKTFLVCFHQFHTECINDWLQVNNKCPICKVRQNQEQSQSQSQSFIEIQIQQDNSESRSSNQQSELSDNFIDDSFDEQDSSQVHIYFEHSHSYTDSDILDQDFQSEQQVDQQQSSQSIISPQRNRANRNLHRANDRVNYRNSLANNRTFLRRAVNLFDRERSRQNRRTNQRSRGRQSINNRSRSSRINSNEQQIPNGRRYNFRQRSQRQNQRRNRGRQNTNQTNNQNLRNQRERRSRR